MIIRNHKPKPLTLTKQQIDSLRKNRPESIGLGDHVERIAKPIAKVIDKVAGTNLQECGGCKKRKEWLNSITSDKKVES